MAIQPHVPTKPSSPAYEAIRSRATTHPLSPIHAQPSQACTPSRSPPRSPSRPKNKTSLSSPHAKAISLPIPDDAPKIKQSTKITQKYNPLDSNYVLQSHNLSHHEKPTKTRSMNPHSLTLESNHLKRWGEYFSSLFNEGTTEGSTEGSREEENPSQWPDIMDVRMRNGFHSSKN
ncbi:hypothetical protein CTI12_AA363600 [Artemisia annua]|uniref:Uncharacterized protein n=1 Tax=Artemisia annua TaxID=35608 RepID=A0A2U1MMK2_ARTAN|nr:hypothetical protein CTI12_AA363600 [Artemisia annua]